MQQVISTNMDAKQLMIEALKSDREEHVQLLQAFVRAASPNPPGETAKATTVLTEYLASKDIPYELITPQPEKPNLVSEFHGSQPGPRVVLNGHSDVFPVGSDTTGWDRDPWSGDIVNDRLHGRGVVDMKSGTTSLVVAYAYLYERRKHLKGSVALCIVSDEETGGKWGTKYLIEQDKAKWGGDVMLSAEPSGRTIRFSEKGTLRLTGKVKTRGAHGAYLNLDKGAIRTAANFLTDIINAIESMDTNPPSDIASYLKDKRVLSVVDQVMGPGTSSIIARPTVNIGIINGGLKVNMIPSICTFELDIRLPIGLTAEQVLEVINDIIPQYQEADIDIMKHEAHSNPSSFSPIDHMMVARLQDNAKALVADYPPTLIPSMGATDCKHYRHANIPAYVYGCSPHGMAMINESASIDEFLQVAMVQAGATWDFLQ